MQDRSFFNARSTQRCCNVLLTLIGVGAITAGCAHRQEAADGKQVARVANRPLCAPTVSTGNVLTQTVSTSLNKKVLVNVSAQADNCGNKPLLGGWVQLRFTYLSGAANPTPAPFLSDKVKLAAQTINTTTQTVCVPVHFPTPGSYTVSPTAAGCWTTSELGALPPLSTPCSGKRHGQHSHGSGEDHHRKSSDSY